MSVIGLVVLMDVVVAVAFYGQAQATDEARAAVVHVEEQTLPLAEASQAAGEFAFAVGTRLFAPGETAEVQDAARRVEEQIRLLEDVDLGAAEAAKDRAIALWYEYSPALLAADPGAGLDPSVVPGLGNIARVTDGFARARSQSVGEVRASLAAAEDQQDRSTRTVALLAGAMTLVVVLGAVASGRSVLGPIRRLREAVSTVGTGNLGHRVPVDGPAELAELARAFNFMAAELEDREAKLLHQTLHDPLTGCGNRLLLHERTTQRLAWRRRHPSAEVAILMVDLDGFKSINDTLGHDAGDEALRIVAARVQPLLRGSDTLVRIGGDEFAVLIDGDAEHATLVAERIVAAIRAPLAIGGDEATLTASIGISTTDDADDEEALLRHADVAMYTAKRAGGDRAERFVTAAGEVEADRRSLVTDLRQAVDNGEIEVHYQPVVRLDDVEVVAVEALVRWRHPRLGLLGPDRFLDEAERTGLIVGIGWEVLRVATVDATAWVAGRPFALSVNVSARQLQDEAFLDQVRAALEQSAFPPDRLVLEITETDAVRDVAAVARRLRPLRALGVRIALDDFGTGYTSLGYLASLPVDFIKIDRTFVHGLADDDDRHALVTTILELAERMHCQVSAEGVERDEDAAVLLELGVTIGQGWRYHRAQPAEDIDALLAAGADQLTSTAGVAP